MNISIILLRREWPCFVLCADRFVIIVICYFVIGLCLCDLFVIVAFSLSIGPSLPLYLSCKSLYLSFIFHAFSVHPSHFSRSFHSKYIHLKTKTNKKILLEPSHSSLQFTSFQNSFD